MRTRLTLTLTLGIAALTLGGCFPRRQVGHFGDNAFYHQRDHYRVRYMEEDARLLPEPWTIENFEVDDSGRPTTVFRESDVDRYRMSQFTQVRRDFEFRAERIDLRYTRRDEVGEIFARSLPMPRTAASMSLSTIIRQSIIAMGTPQAQGVTLIGHGVPAGTEVRIHSEGDAQVDDQRGYYVTFDLVVRHSDSGQEHTRRVTLVAVALPPDDFAWRVRRWRMPMLVLFGHISHPERHRAQQDAFESFVERVDFAEQS